MTSVFLTCAALGGTILVCQLLMTVIGLGGHDVGGDIADDPAGHFGGDVHGGDAAGDAQPVVHLGHDAGPSHGAGPAHAAGADTHAGLHRDSSWLFGVISFRTVVAAITFFGLAGMTAQSTRASAPVVLLVALAAGASAMYLVYWAMRSLARLRAQGNVRLERAVGGEASVYLRIPPHNSGSGKIQINLQNRTMEYLAVTAGEALPTGARVVVVAIVDPLTVAVAAAPASCERNSHVVSPVGGTARAE